MGNIRNETHYQELYAVKHQENHPKSHYSGKLLFAWCRDKFYKLAYLITTIFKQRTRRNREDKIQA